MFMFWPKYKSDPRVSVRAGHAWMFAADYLGIANPGERPPVVLTEAPWNDNGTEVIGNYSWFSFFGWLMNERVKVVNNPSYMMSNLVHEFIHCLRVRDGHRTNEQFAEAAESLAKTYFNQSQLKG